MPLKKKKSLWKMLIIILILGIFSGTAILIAFFTVYKPSIKNIVPFDTESLNNDNLQNDDKTPIKVETNNSQYDRKENFYTFLIVGKDVISNNTDVMILASYDLVNKNMSLMQIPRDTYVNIGRNFYRINAIYTSEYNRAKNSGDKKADTTGMIGLVDILQKNLNINIDYYIQFTTEGFRNIIDILGGVEIDVPSEMNYEDPEQNLYIHLNKGPQLLDGSDAEGFVRYRYGYVDGNMGRISAQKLFMTALIEQVKSNITPSKISKIIEQATKHILTSIPIKDSIYFAKELLSVEMENFKIMNLPSGEVKNPNTGAWYNVIYREEALKTINDYFNVYKKNISDAIFDINRIFTNEKQSYISNIYNIPLSLSSPEENEVYD